MATAGIRRVAGIGLGLFTHALFLVTVWYLFWFLKGPGRTSEGGVWWWDSLLAMQFAVVHSLLLLPATRQRLGRWIASEFYGLFYCVATCAGLLVLFAGWRTSPVVIWELQDGAATAVTWAFYASWAALVYSLSLTGLGYQTGLTPWLYWLRGRPVPRREFRPRGAYHLLRHPVYLSFLGLVWFTPTMTLDHAVLTGIWTAYIFLGSHLKDRRLVYYLGDTYRRYQTRVAGYPFFFGPLGKLRPRPEAVAAAHEASTPVAA